jgi:superfamily II DNA or RNA helicase
MNFLKPFQTKIYKELINLLAKNKTAMLAAATGSGKTEMMCQFIVDNPKLRVLILAHGQKSLRTNFSDRLSKYDIQSFEMVGRSDKRGVDLANKARVVVALPQNIHKKLKAIKKFDVVIVDEAHEFYMPKDYSVMYPKIKAWHNGKWILLSASHYRIEAQKVFFSRENALAVGQIADATVRLIEEVAKINDKDISRDGFLKESVNVPTSVQVVAKVLSEKGRTPAIVAKHSVAAARELATDLAKVYKGKICVSDASSDPLGENLEAFKAGKYDVCIVVYRGNLGFDYPAMATFIDGSYTTNIPRMEQMLGRVVRIGGNSNDKKFIKLVPANAWTRGMLLVTAVLSLSKDEMYREWKGDEAKIKLPGKPAEILNNLNGMTRDESFGDTEPTNIPQIGSPTESNGGHKEESEIGGTTRQTTETNKKAEGTLSSAGKGKPIDAKEPRMKTRKTLELSFGHLIGMFKGKDSCTLRQAINYAGVENVVDATAEKKRILKEMARNGEKRPSTTSKNPEERSLGNALSNYTRGETSESYDPKFTKELKKINSEWFINSADEKKKILKEMAKNGLKRPSPTSENPEERSLGRALLTYTGKASKIFDSVLTKELKKLNSKWFNSSDEKKRILKEMAKNGEKRPSAASKNPEERTLGVALTNYTRGKTSDSYDPKLTKELTKLNSEWFSRRRRKG